VCKTFHSERDRKSFENRSVHQHPNIRGGNLFLDFEKGLHWKLVFFLLYSEDVRSLVHLVVRSLAQSSVKLDNVSSPRRFYSIAVKGRVFLFSDLLSTYVNKSRKLLALASPSPSQPPSSIAIVTTSRACD